MVRVILLTLVFAAVCSFLEVEAKFSTKRTKNASPSRVEYGPQRPSSTRSKRKASKEKDSSGIIVFPNDTQERPEDPPLDVPPPCPDGLTYCENVEKYPSKHIAKLLSQDISMFRGFFEVPNEIEDRIEPIGEYESLCTSKEQTMRPQKAKNKDDIFLYIVNQDEYIQSVSYEECQNAGQECTFASSFPAGYKTECKQKYIYKKLLAVNRSQVFPDSFPFPSCCSCVYKPPSLAARMGVPESVTPITKKPKSSK